MKNPEYMHMIPRQSRLIQMYCYMCKKVIKNNLMNYYSEDDLISQTIPDKVRKNALKGLTRLAKEEDLLSAMEVEQIGVRISDGDAFNEDELKSLRKLQNKYMNKWIKKGKPKDECYTDVLLLGGSEGQDWVKESLAVIKKG